jgi:G3E family GTPase
MPEKVRMVIIGGFLGAGKTTLITKLAKQLRSSNVNVGLIMNDQADALVDTQYSRALGLDSCEVSGGCFCCRFPDFMRNAEKLMDTSRPQMVIAEPVGSCTDLLATVVNPLKRIYSERFEVAPLIIMVDTARVLAEGFDRNQLNGYLRHHQVCEAEVLVLSKSDLVTPEQLERVRSAVLEVNPKVRTIVYSSLSEEGFPEIVGVVSGKQTSDRKPTDIDYSLYAQAEAELGWYNSTVAIDLPSRTDAFDLGKQFLRSLSELYPAGDVAHAKIILTTASAAMKMSCVQGRLTVDLAKGSRFADGKGRLTVNARVVSSPEDLRKNVRSALAKTLPGELDFETEECFSPSPPKPFHRMRD